MGSYKRSRQRGFSVAACTHLTSLQTSRCRAAIMGHQWLHGCVTGVLASCTLVHSPKESTDAAARCESVPHLSPSPGHQHPPAAGVGSDRVLCPWARRLQPILEPDRGTWTQSDPFGTASRASAVRQVHTVWHASRCALWAVQVSAVWRSLTWIAVRQGTLLWCAMHFTAVWRTQMWFSAHECTPPRRMP